MSNVFNRHAARSSLYAYIVLVKLCLVSTFSYAGYVSHQLMGNELRITTDEHTVTFTPHNGSAIAVTYNSTFHPTLPSYAIAESSQVSQATLAENSGSLIFTSGNISAVIDKASMEVSFNNVASGNSAPLITQTQYRDSETGIAFDFEISDVEKLMGGGQRVLGMDRRGHKLPLYNKAHYGYTTESSQMYYGLSAVMSSNKYVVIFDNSATGEMDLDSQTTNTLSFSGVSGRASYVVVAGDTYPSLIHNFVNLTGKQPMPPRWALGNFASRFGYRTQQEVLDVAQKFADDDIPLDAIVLDLYWFGKDVQGHMGNLDWDRDTFPTPEKMIDALEEKGVNTVVITEPFILSTSKKWQSATENNALGLDAEGKPYRFDFYFGNTGLVDIFNNQGRDWFAQAYNMLAAQGVTGWWGDLGEPEVQPDDILHTMDDGMQVRGDAIHNAYGHKWAEMVFKLNQSFAPNKRPMIMMRSGFVGSQRYGMIPWTGDVSRSWGGLQPQVELSLQMGLLGLAYTHSDLGGFAGGEVFDSEMYTRWLQYGVFQPVYRPHAQENIAPEPIFHDDKTKDIVREFIKLRYRMLPYVYTLAYENSMTGMPLMRPLMFEDEQNQSLIADKNSYLWGDAFLVTPVVKPGLTTVTTNVPEGIWFDFWTGERVSGGQTVEQATSLDTLPVLVRAGSFVPMADDMSSTKAFNNALLNVHYYHDSSIKKSSGQAYEDDGISVDSIEKGAYQLLTFAALNSGNTLRLEVNSSGKGYQGQASEKQINYLVHNVTAEPRFVVVGGKKLPMLASEQALALSTAGAYWSAKDKVLTIKSWFTGKPASVKVAL